MALTVSAEGLILCQSPPPPQKNIRSLLNELRLSAKTEREKGSYFERLAVAFFKNDAGWQHEFEDVWLYSDWAAEHGKDRRDTGIDIVAKRRHGKFCAIQCKFYSEGHKVSKKDIESFFTESGKRDFDQRIIVDTSDVPWSEHADESLKDQDKPAIRVGLTQFENSNIDWSHYFQKDEVKVRPPKKLIKHQIEAIEAIQTGFNTADRGKLILACGTGKTFTSLKLAEDIVGKGGYALFMVPSLALMGQAIRDWTLDAGIPLRVFAVCSDTHIGKRKKSLSDELEIEIHDLEYPATTNAERLAEHANIPAPKQMTVVFATYQSIHVLEDAQKKYGLPNFDLAICDEAHRTTGATLENTKESNFVKIHDNDNVSSRKRLYMTATPKVYGKDVKTKAKEESVELYSMDNTQWYGETFYARGFSWAVENKLLTDYKVIVLAVDEKMVSREIERRLAESEELKLDDATKIVGCYKALAKIGSSDEFENDPQPMKRGLAFCRDIKSSKLIEDEFKKVIDDYMKVDDPNRPTVEEGLIDCKVKHVDGTFNGKVRMQLLDWLRDEENENQCRILTNARCLSEGIDVPALDGIMFLHPRKSQIDVVQAVGRVMRLSKNKKMGYVILPIGVPTDISPEDALNDNKRYQVIWQILNALRSHDESFDAAINSGNIEKDLAKFIEIIAVSDTLPSKQTGERPRSEIGEGSASDPDDTRQDDLPEESVGSQGELYFEEYSKAVMAKIVKQCGRRDYWEDWAKDIARIAETHITRLSTILEKPGTQEREQFDKFLLEIRDDLNDSVTEEDAIEMLAQHLITKPVFDALFGDYKFTERNSVSVALQNVVDAIDKHKVSKEVDSLQKFYQSVSRRASAIKDKESKQAIIVELYNKFFLHAFPKTVQRLGIVYTPVEVVDFILHSVNDILKTEFNQTLASRNVHILEPFAGTGTFITRLIQSGLIPDKELPYKYKNEIFANEIVLLAYYIAAINIEDTFHSKVGGEYEPFRNICLTDTFQLHEQEKDLISDLMQENSDLRKHQKNQPIQVIVSNPPYSIGQRRQNDNAQNLYYKSLFHSVTNSYAKHSNANLKKSLYDSYVLAMRWASDRIGDSGIVALNTNAGWIDGNSTDGIRKCLEDEFTSVYVIHLRGNLRTIGEEASKEGGNVFEHGTRTPVAISILVRNPKKINRSKTKIKIYEIGEYMSRSEKLDKLTNVKSIGEISSESWIDIVPNKHNDWLNQRSDKFESFVVLGDKKVKQKTVFEIYSLGVVTARDAWTYNFGKQSIKRNMSRMIEMYNEERNKFFTTNTLSANYDIVTHAKNGINNDSTKISWTANLIKDLTRNTEMMYEPSAAVKSLYRPFTKQWLYYDRHFNERVYQMPKIFPIGEQNTNNRIIMTDSKFNGYGMIALMADTLPNLDVLGGAQSFPLYKYGDKENNGKVSAVSNDGIKLLTDSFSTTSISREDIFYYIYGILHSIEYIEQFKHNLAKQLPRIPRVKREEDFWAFSKAGRELGDLHCGYEEVEPFNVTFSRGDVALSAPDDPEQFYRVTKMKFAKKGDKSTVIYNNNITITDIPLEAYDYVINRKPALEWVMDRQCVKTDKRSGIVNDANRYAVETVGDPAYPLKLFQRVITVSLETMRIVRSLPKLDIDI